MQTMNTMTRVSSLNGSHGAVSTASPAATSTTSATPIAASTRDARCVIARRFEAVRRKPMRCSQALVAGAA